MAWKPWYERAAEIDNAQEREEFIRGALYGRTKGSGMKVAESVLIGALVGWGVSSIAKKIL